VPPNPLSRRKFLTGLAGAGAVAAAGWGVSDRLVGRTAAAANPAGRPGSSAGGPGGPLVLVGLYGGNDGLNTVIPYEDSRYLSGRGALGYQPGEVISLGDGLGLHPNLKGLKKLWDAGRLAIVRGVGYPDPVLSHFRSMAIWQSASPQSEVATGWVGRWLDSTGRDPLRAISVGPTLPLMAAGEKTAASAVPTGPMTLPGAAPLRSALAGLSRSAASSAAGGPLAARVGQTGSDLLEVQAVVSEALAKVPEAEPGNTNGLDNGAPAGATRAAGNPLATQLDTVARLIKAGVPTRIYMVSLGGFDTHSAEKATHAALMGQLDQAVSAFLAEMQTDPHGAHTVVATFSEFGRRVAANASAGTDHGTAAPLFVAGGPVKGGFYGEEPSLANLDMGDLRYTTDFRSVYATLLGPLLGYDPSAAIQGRFPTLGFA
jgi:uncharacterized protein (DUF1501 family)